MTLAALALCLVAGTGVLIAGSMQKASEGGATTRPSREPGPMWDELAARARGKPDVLATSLRLQYEALRDRCTNPRLRKDILEVFEDLEATPVVREALLFENKSLAISAADYVKEVHDEEAVPYLVAALKKLNKRPTDEPVEYTGEEGALHSLGNLRFLMAFDSLTGRDFSRGLTRRDHREIHRAANRFLKWAEQQDMGLPESQEKPRPSAPRTQKSADAGK